MSSILQQAVNWTKANTTVVVPLTDVVDVHSRKGLDIKNNICEVTVKNANKLYVDATNNCVFGNKDRLTVFAQLNNTGANLDTTAWQDSTTLIGNFLLKEIKHTATIDKQQIKVIGVDEAYILFNKVFSKQFGLTEKFTAPGAFRSAVRLNTASGDASNPNDFSGTDEDSGTKFKVDARFVSEGGSITDYRDSPTTQLNGSITSSSTTITVDSTVGFQDEGTLVIGSEHIYYSGITPTTFTGCERGIDLTMAVS